MPLTKQCKNRIDTLKKKYKSQMRTVGFQSKWGFFQKMNDLVGCVYFGQKKGGIPVGVPLLTNGQGSSLSQTSRRAKLTCRRSGRPSLPLGLQLMPQKWPTPVPVDDDSCFGQTSRPSKLTCQEPLEVQPVSYFSPEREPMGIPFLPNQQPAMMSQTQAPPPVVDDSYFSSEREPMGAQPAMMPQEQASPPVVDDSSFRNMYSAVAAAAAAELDDVGKEEEEAVHGIKRLAEAMERFAEMYDRVQKEAQKQKIELEKQRMLFEKDMEEQRMKFFMDAQVELEKIKRARRSGSNGSGS